MSANKFSKMIVMSVKKFSKILVMSVKTVFKIDCNELTVKSKRNDILKILRQLKIMRLVVLENKFLGT